ncbi:MAG: transcriptional regulator, TetR family [Clostridia bacterium]|jgi:AcrR family transcriptional regulator|nr:transcriptional regulator, TetR family [Clostridia bacterium]
MAVKPTPREIKSSNTRQALLDSAINLFLEHGVKKVTIDDICADCGLSKGAFYHNFPSKDHIVAFAVNSGLDKYLTHHFVLNNSLTVIEQLISLNLSSFDYFKYIGKEMTRASYEGQIRSCVDVRVFGRTYVDTLTALVQRGFKENCFYTRISENDTYMLCIAVFSGMLAKWCTQDDKTDSLLDWSRMIEEQFRIMVKSS